MIILVFTHKKPKWLGRIMLRNAFKKELKCKDDYYSDDEHKFTIDIRKVGVSIVLWDKNELNNMIEIVNRINKKIPVFFHCENIVTKDEFKLIDSNLDCDYCINKYYKFRDN